MYYCHLTIGGPGGALTPPGPAKTFWEVLTCPRVRDAPLIGVPMRRSRFALPPTALERSMSLSGQPFSHFVLSCASELPLAGWASATRTLRVLVQIALWASR